MLRATLAALVTVPALLLAGCAGDPSPALTTRQTVEDSLVLLTVDSASPGLTYGSLVVLADNTPFKLGGRMDHAQGLFEVQGKDNPSDAVALGDIIRMPLSGRVSLELRHRDGTSLQQLDLDVPDHTPPSAPTLSAPTPGASGVPRETVFLWAPLDDPASLTYSLEYWVGSSALNGPPTLVSDLPGSTYAIPSDDRLLPATTYHWRVRAVDGAGNIGPWSAESEFTTSV